MTEVIILVGKVYRSIILVGSWLPLGARSFQTSHQNERSFRWETSKFPCAIILADHFGPISLVGKVYRSIDHFGGRTMSYWWERTVQYGDVI